MKMPRLIAALPVLLALAGPAARGADAPPDKELEAQADDFARRYSGADNNTYKGMVDDLVREVAKVAGCDSDTLKALKGAAVPVAEKVQAHWVAVFHAYYLAHSDKLADGTLWDDYPEMLDSDLCHRGLREAAGQWQELLRTHLTPEQLRLWQEELKKREARRQKAGETGLAIALEKRQQLVRKNLETLVDRIARVTDMSAGRKAALGPVLETAISAHLEIIRVRAGKCVRLWGEDFLKFSTRALEQLEEGMSKTYAVSINTRSARLAFDAAADKALLPEEKQRLAHEAAAVRTRIEAAAARLPDGEYFRPRRLAAAKEWEARTTSLLRTVPLGDERQAAFKEKAAQAGEKAEKEWAKVLVTSCIERIQKTCDGLSDPESFLANVEQGQYAYRDDKQEAATNEARARAWQELTGSLLTPAEQEQLRQADLRARQRYAQVAALTVMAELDQRLLLSPAQHQALEPLAVQAAKDYPLTYAEMFTLWQQQSSGSLVLVHAMGLHEVEAVLQESQKAAFRELAERHRYSWAKLRPKKQGKT